MDYNQEKEKNNPADGMVGIRQTLRDMGFSDSQIGYNEKTNTVTLGGKDLMKPGFLDNDAGVSYAKKSDIQKSVVNRYQNTENPVVRVSDAYAAMAGPYGLSANALTYGNGTVSVGGKPIHVLYVDDEGKAWARESSIADAVENYAGQSGVDAPNELANYYRKKYLSGAENILTELSKRDEFSYNPEDDPVFLAYRNKYRLEGERAGREAVSDLATLTGGYANSAAVTAGAQARQYYAKQISDVIPQLAQQAFDRYVEKYQADLDLADQMIRLYDKVYGDALSANQEQAENVNAVAKSNVERDQEAWAKNWKDLQYRQDYEMTEEERDWDRVKNALDLAKQNLENQGLFLSNQKAETYLAYYEQLIREELSGMELKNKQLSSKL